jgi:hypothetical protein
VHGEAEEKQRAPPEGAEDEPARGARREERKREEREPVGGGDPEESGSEDGTHHRKRERAGQRDDVDEQRRRRVREVERDAGEAGADDEAAPDAVHLLFDEALQALVTARKEQDGDRVDDAGDHQRSEVEREREAARFDDETDRREGGEVRERVEHPEQPPVLGHEVIAGLFDDLADQPQRRFCLFALHRDPACLPEDAAAVAAGVRRL